MMEHLTPRLVVLTLALALLAVGICLCAIRIVRGPSPFDRVLAFDCVVLNAVGAILVVSILLDAYHFMDVVLVVTLLGFVSTISLAAYLEGTLVD